MRDEKTLNTIQDRKEEAEINAYFEANHIPKPAGAKMAPLLARSMSSKSPRTSELLKPKKESSVKQLPPIKKGNADVQEQEMKNLIKKNLLFEKPKNYSKLQMHNKAMNSKVDDPSIAPERYHSSKLIAEFEAKKVKEEKHKLLPTQPDSTRYASNPLKAVAPKGNPAAVSLKVEADGGLKAMRQEKNDMLSQYYKSKKTLKP